MRRFPNIGTCSWKYDSWEGIVYSSARPDNYLAEYSHHFGTVEIDQWFWSLFAGDKVVLPKAAVVREYAASVPDDFRFGVKVPNSITLTHHYAKQRKTPLQPNPFFLSYDLMMSFLESLEPLHEKLGPLIFQFEYLNKMKMAGREHFIEKLTDFSQALPDGFLYCLETRNPNYLGKEYFTFLKRSGFRHVFLQGYFMPSVFELYQKYADELAGPVIMRLHGPDRKGIEAETGKKWHSIVAPKDDDIARLVTMLSDLGERGLESYVFVNNHFEGSAPRTIQKIKAGLTDGQGIPDAVETAEDIDDLIAEHFGDVSGSGDDVYFADPRCEAILAGKESASSKVEHLLKHYVKEYGQPDDIDEEYRHPAILALHNRIEPWLVVQCHGEPAIFWNLVADAVWGWFPKGVTSREAALFSTLFDMERLANWDDTEEFHSLALRFERWKSGSTG